MTPSIKNPCPEKWDGMTPDEQGRFCGKCSKIVFDFTKKTTQEIIAFLTARKGEDICGRLRKPALFPLSPSTTLSLTSGRIKTFLVALYLVFGSMLFTSCGPAEQEEPVGKVGLDSASEAQHQREQDSINAASAVTTTTVAYDSTHIIDSADMMRTMNILDSIAKSKNK